MGMVSKWAHGPEDPTYGEGQSTTGVRPLLGTSLDVVARRCGGTGDVGGLCSLWLCIQLSSRRLLWQQPPAFSPASSPFPPPFSPPFSLFWAFPKIEVHLFSVLSFKII